MVSQDKVLEGFKMTELGFLPKEWKVVRLGELATLNLGRTPPRKEDRYWNGGIVPWVSIKDLNNGTVLDTAEKISEQAFSSIFKGRYVPKGTLLLSFKLTIGKVGILGVDAVHNEAIASVFPNEAKISRDFLFFLLQSIDYDAFLDAYVKGKTLNKRKLNALPIPLSPLPEQRRIAHVLSTIQRAIAAQDALRLLPKSGRQTRTQDALIAGARELKRSLMRHLFTYGPVPLEQAARVSLKETEIGPVPAHWEVVRLGDIAAIGNGSTPRRTNPAYWKDGTIPWLTSAKVHEVIIQRADEFVTERAVQECHLPLVPKGSIVVAITGQGKTLGNAALVTFDTTINQHLAYVTIRHAHATPEFALGYLHHRYENLRQASRAGGSTKGALTCGFLKGYPLPLPPFQEQLTIANALGAISAKIEAEEARKTALQALFKTMLHQLMTGQVRVPEQTSEVWETSEV